MAASAAASSRFRDQYASALIRELAARWLAHGPGCPYRPLLARMRNAL